MTAIVFNREVHVERREQQDLSQQTFEARRAMSQFMSDINTQDSAADSHADCHPQQLEEGAGAVGGLIKKQSQQAALDGDHRVQQPVVESTVEEGCFGLLVMVDGVGSKDRFHKWNYTEGVKNSCETQILRPPDCGERCSRYRESGEVFELLHSGFLIVGAKSVQIQGDKVFWKEPRLARLFMLCVHHVGRDDRAESRMECAGIDFALHACRDAVTNAVLVTAHE